MEHDSRPKEGVELKAPEGKFRLVETCLPGHATYVVNDFNTLEEATASVKARHEKWQGLSSCIYDDQGALKN